MRAETSLGVTEANDAATYGFAIMSLLCLAFTIFLISDLLTLARAFKHLLYNLHLRSRNPFARPPRSVPRPRPPPVLDIPYYMRPLTPDVSAPMFDDFRSRQHARNIEEHYRKRVRIAKKKRIYLSQ